MVPQVKRCLRCREVLPLEAFSKRSRGGKRGRQSWCKDCYRAARTEGRRQQEQSERYW